MRQTGWLGPKEWIVECAANDYLKVDIWQVYVRWKGGKVENWKVELELWFVKHTATASRFTTFLVPVSWLSGSGCSHATGRLPVSTTTCTALAHKRKIPPDGGCLWWSSFVESMEALREDWMYLWLWSVIKNYKSHPHPDFLSFVKRQIVKTRSHESSHKWRQTRDTEDWGVRGEFLCWFCFLTYNLLLNDRWFLTGSSEKWVSITMSDCR